MAAGTKEDPWLLKTAPGTSEYSMYKDPQASPPALVCQVGSTTLKYHLRAVEDLHAWLSVQEFPPLTYAVEGLDEFAKLGVKVSRRILATGGSSEPPPVT